MTKPFELTDELGQFGYQAIVNGRPRTEPTEPSGPYKPLDWEELFTKDTPPEDWLAFPIIAARRSIALYSEPKAGKSLLTLELAVGIALGRSVLGQPAQAARKVMYIDHENDPEGDIKTRLQAMGIDWRDLVGQLFYVSFPAAPPVNTEAGGAALLTAAQGLGVAVVVIDTVARTVEGKENSNDTWNALYLHCGQKLKAARIGSVRLDHSGKDADLGQRGGSAKAGDVDAVWQLTAITDTKIKLRCTHRRFLLAPEDQELTLTRRADPLRHVVNANGWASRVDEVNHYLDELDADNQISNQDARDLLRSAAHTIENTTIAEALRARKRRPDHAFRKPAEQDPDETVPDDHGTQRNDVA